MSGELVKLLCSAEIGAQETGVLIGEKHLLRAFLADGGGEIGLFLARSGVRLRRLLP